MAEGATLVSLTPIKKTNRAIKFYTKCLEALVEDRDVDRIMVRDPGRERGGARDLVGADPCVVYGAPAERRFWVIVSFFPGQSPSNPASSSTAEWRVTTAWRAAIRRAPAAIVTERTVGA